MASTSTFSAPDSIISAGPYVHFDANGTVSVLWKTAQPADSTVEFGTTRDLGTKAADSQLTLDHQIPLPELLPETEYYFRIRSRAGDTESVSDIEPFDSTFERVPSIPWEERRPYENDFISATCADKILQETGIRNGYCLVLGFGEGRLAYELAARSNLRIIGIDDDPKAVATARNLFKDTGIYGSRISVHEGNLDSLPYSDYFADLIVSEKMLTTGEICGSASEIMRLLRPDGGTAWLGTPSATGKTLTPAALKNWAEQGAIQNYSIQEQDGLWLTFQRPALNGAGEWTHMYAEPATRHAAKIPASNSRPKSCGSAGRGRVSWWTAIIAPCHLCSSTDVRSFRRITGSSPWSLTTAQGCGTWMSPAPGESVLCETGARCSLPMSTCTSPRKTNAPRSRSPPANHRYSSSCRS